MQINTVNKCWCLEMNLQDMQITNRWKITSICLACHLDTMHLQGHLIFWWNVSISKLIIHCRRTSNARSWMIYIHFFTMKRFDIWKFFHVSSLYFGNTPTFMNGHVHGEKSTNKKKGSLSTDRKLNATIRIFLCKLNPDYTQVMNNAIQF